MCITLFLVTIFIPVSAFKIQKQQYNEMNLSHNKNTKIKIFDYSGDRLTTTEKTLSSNQIEKIIKVFFETRITEEFCYKQVKQRIKILQENDLISTVTLNFLSRKFETNKKFFEFRNEHTPKTTAADVNNILNLIIFGLKGVKDQTILELLFRELEFFNGTIAGRFSLLGSWSGKGFVYTLGAFGFRNIYEFDQDLYPDFPHMPDIEGTNYVFIGILIDIIAETPDIQGQYYIGVGTTLLTTWNKN